MAFQKLIENYLDTEAYGCNLIMKEYINFPRYLPLPCHMEHGWTPLPNALISDLSIAQEKRLMLVYSKRRETAWKRATKIPAKIIGSPFVIYRKMKKIELSSQAKGTIAFPSHSTIFLESRYNIDDYCRKLKELPEEFQPVTVCLLYPDIKRGRDKIYEKYGFKVVSAGKKLRGSLEFVRKYYRILSNHKYATSNEIGTYTFYAVELGLPFFLYGEEPVVINEGGKDPNIGERAKTSDFIFGQKAVDVFNTGPVKKINKKQRQFVNQEFGLTENVGPMELRRSLVNNTKNVHYWLELVPMFFLLSIVRRLIPTSFAYWIFERINKK